MILSRNRFKQLLLSLLPLSVIIYLYLQSKSFTFPPLPPLLERDRLWPPDLDTPLYNLKIYIYEIPIELQLSQQQITKCRWSSYSSELLLNRVLLNLPNATQKHLTITKNIQEADFYFIPLFPACYLFNCWEQNGWNQELRCEVEEKYIEPILNFVERIGKFNEIRNHIIIHPMDRSDTYYKDSTRRRMRKAIYLVTNGDLRSPPHSNYYRNSIDIVIPSVTPLLHSYYINPRNYLNSLGHPFQNVLTSQISPSSQPNQVEIYEPSSSTSSNQNTRSRSILAIFRGSPSTNEGERYSLLVRDLFFPSTTHPGFSSLPNYSIKPTEENQESYARDLSISEFGLVPPGYTLDTTRIYEYLAFGVIPIFLATGNRGGQELSFSKFIDYDSFSITIPRERVHLLPEILKKVGKEEKERLRKGVWELGRELILEETRGNTVRLIARELCTRLIAERGL